MARKRVKTRYAAPKAPKQKKGGATREFEVAPGCTVFDVNGKRCTAGMNAELSEEHANFFANLNYIKVELRFDDEPDGETTKSAPSDADKAGDGDTADAAGGKPSDGPSADEPAKAKRKPRSGSGSATL